MRSKTVRVLALAGLALYPALTGFAHPDTVRRGGARPGPAVAAVPSDAWVDATLASLDLRDRVGQMVVAWIEGGRPARGSAEYERGMTLVRDRHVGGLIVGK